MEISSGENREKFSNLTEEQLEETNAAIESYLANKQGKIVSHMTAAKGIAGGLSFGQDWDERRQEFLCEVIKSMLESKESITE